MWTNWKAKFGKDQYYAAGVEDDYRLRVFYSHVKEVQEHYRAVPKKSWDVELNFLADLTYEEMKEQYMLGQEKIDEAKKILEDEVKNGVTGLEPMPEDYDWKDMPSRWDWREKGCVNPIKSQGQCGSCWAFGGMAAMETEQCKTHGDLNNYSEQQSVDCIYSYGGCRGGWYYK